MLRIKKLYNERVRPAYRKFATSVAGRNVHLISVPLQNLPKWFIAAANLAPTGDKTLQVLWILITASISKIVHEFCFKIKLEFISREINFGFCCRTIGYLSEILISFWLVDSCIVRSQQCSDLANFFSDNWLHFHFIIRSDLLPTNGLFGWRSSILFSPFHFQTKDFLIYHLTYSFYNILFVFVFITIIY